MTEPVTIRSPDGSTLSAALAAPDAGDGPFPGIIVLHEIFGLNDDIRRITARTQVPVEVFVHGALCVAYSGQCLTSEALGGRSANRGQCAQACRMPYELIVDGEARDTGERAYLLEIPRRGAWLGGATCREPWVPPTVAGQPRATNASRAAAL